MIATATSRPDPFDTSSTISEEITIVIINGQYYEVTGCIKVIDEIYDLPPIDEVLFETLPDFEFEIALDIAQEKARSDYYNQIQKFKTPQVEFGIWGLIRTARFSKSGHLPKRINKIRKGR